MFRYLAILILTVQISGCSNIYSRVTFDFESLAISPQIKYEKGSEELALYVSENLAELISEVEGFQYRRFKAPTEIQIYVFDDKERYSNYSAASIRTRGSATTNEIYISPIIRERMETFSSILKHELSHIHLRQYVGTWGYVKNIPGWFHEGLAVEASNGGGAEKVSDDEAIEFIKKGNHFLPKSKGSILGHKTAHDYGLKPHMYYRQSNLFIRFLKEVNVNSFEKCYLSLTEGVSFDEVWIKYYGKDLDKLWEIFLEETQE